MRCARCQQQKCPGRKFCSECGASLTLACATWGFSNEPGEKFCRGCGTPLVATTIPQFAALETIAETRNHPYSLANALVGLGIAMLRSGRFVEAVALVEGDVELCRAFGFDEMLATELPV